MKYRFCIGPVAALILLDGAVRVGHASPQTDRRAEPLAVVLAIDTGSSSRIELNELREGLRRFVDRLASTDRAELCSFGERLQCAPFTRDHRALLEEIGSIRDHDSARTFDSVDQAIDDLRAVNGRRVVVVFSMAPDTPRAVNPKSVLADARAMRATVYAVGLDVRYFDGDEFVDGNPDPELEKLVRETGGTYVEVEAADDLPAAFARLGREIR